MGTGLNAHPKYAKRVAEVISEITGVTFISAPNKFEALAANDADRRDEWRPQAACLFLL